MSNGESNVWCETDGENEDRGPNGDVGIEINKTKLMVMGREPALRPQKGVGANSIWYQSYERWYHQRCLGIRILRRAGDNFRCPTCVRGVVAMLWRLQVGEDSLEVCDFM